MQPTIVFTASTPGLIFINGRLAGEASTERPLFMPIAPYGAVYIEYHPLTSGQIFSAWKCVFSGGKLMPDSIENVEGLFAISWPGNILEIEFAPVQRSCEIFYLENIPCTLRRGNQTTLLLGNLSLSLPDRALPPKLEHIHDIPILSGRLLDGGQYLLTLTQDYSLQTGFLVADRIDFDGQNSFNALISMGDFAGHAKLEHWLIDGNGLRRTSSDFTWKDGAPRRPESPEETVIAAIEAAIIGLTDESYAYFTPSLKNAAPLNAVCDLCELCVSMKYGAPDSRTCIGLMQARNPHLAVVSPLYYHAIPMDNTHQTWMIDWLSTT